MKVYVSEIGWPWEGRNVVGVYTTMESAKAAFAELTCGDQRFITKIEVDAAPVWPREPEWSLK